MKAELLSIREYATYHNITEQAVYKKIKAGKLSTVTIQENGKPKQYIYIPEAAAGADQSPATVPAADPVPAAAPRARAGNPSPLPDVSDPDTEAAAAAADPERISPRASHNQASQQRPQDAPRKQQPPGQPGTLPEIRPALRAQQRPPGRAAAADPSEALPPEAAAGAPTRLTSSSRHPERIRPRPPSPLPIRYQQQPPGRAPVTVPAAGRARSGHRSSCRRCRSGADQSPRIS